MLYLGHIFIGIGKREPSTLYLDISMLLKNIVSFLLLLKIDWQGRLQKLSPLEHIAWYRRKSKQCQKSNQEIIAGKLRMKYLIEFVLYIKIVLKSYMFFANIFFF